MHSVVYMFCVDCCCFSDMAKVKPSQETMADEVPIIDYNQPPPQNNKKSTYCMLCRHWLWRDVSLDSFSDNLICSILG